MAGGGASRRVIMKESCTIIDADRDRALLCYIELIARTCDVTSSRNSYRDLHDRPLSLSPRSVNRELDRGDQGDSKSSSTTLTAPLPIRS